MAQKKVYALRLRRLLQSFEQIAVCRLSRSERSLLQRREDWRYVLGGKLRQEARPAHPQDRRLCWLLGQEPLEDRQSGLRHDALDALGLPAQFLALIDAGCHARFAPW